MTFFFPSMSVLLPSATEDSVASGTSTDKPISFAGSSGGGGRSTEEPSRSEEEPPSSRAPARESDTGRPVFLG